MTEEYSIFISARKMIKDGSKIYAVDLYCNNIYEIDMKSGMVNVIGELSNEKEQVYTIFDIHICDNKLVMIPRNGEYIHIFDIKKKVDLIYDLRKNYSFMDNEANDCFSFPFDGKIYMYYRNNGLVLMFDYVNKCIQEIVTDKKYERLQLAGSFAINNSIYMPSLSLNRIIVYSVNNKVIEIHLPEELRGITKVYKIENYFVAYHDSSHNIYLLNHNGEIEKRFYTGFSEKQIEPLVCKVGKNILVFGNSNGEFCKIDLENNCIETRNIEDLKNMEVDFLGENGGYIYCFQMTKSYEQFLNNCIKINSKTLEVIKIKLELNKLSFKKDINLIYNRNISRYLMKKTICFENCSINLNSFLQCNFNKTQDCVKDNHECGHDILRKIIN